MQKEGRAPFLELVQHEYSRQIGRIGAGLNEFAELLRCGTGVSGTRSDQLGVPISSG